MININLNIEKLSIIIIRVLVLNFLPGFFGEQSL